MGRMAMAERALGLNSPEQFEQLGAGVRASPNSSNPSARQDCSGAKGLNTLRF